MTKVYTAGGSRGYVTTQEVPWEVGKEGSGLFIHIPKGFEFESSVPKWLPKFIMDPDDPRFLPAAMIHDCMLRRGFGAISSGAEWYRAARFEGVSKWGAFIRVLPVLIFTISRRK